MMVVIVNMGAEGMCVCVCVCGGGGGGAKKFCARILVGVATVAYYQVSKY